MSRAFLFGVLVGPWLWCGACAIGFALLTLPSAVRSWWRVRRSERFLRRAQVEHKATQPGHRPECQCRACWDRRQIEAVLAQAGMTREAK